MKNSEEKEEKEEITMVEIRNLQVCKNDLKRIGHSAYGADDGTLCKICDAETAKIEEILLRNILLCFGEQYRILSSEDFVWETTDGTEIIDIEFSTNLPFSVYMSL